MPRFTFIFALALFACDPISPAIDASVFVPDAAIIDAGIHDSGVGDSGSLDPKINPFADRVSSFSPGTGAGFGADKMPDIVLGPPKGAGSSSGSLDVVSLGFEGSIDLEFTDLLIIDGPGPDFIVFENGFTGFLETGMVSVSFDGGTFTDFPCEIDAGGCAGLNPVFANDELNISATNPNVSGGDAFDLATLGIAEVHFVRIKDSGKNRFYGAPSGGFDLDAVSIINGRSVKP